MEAEITTKEELVAEIENEWEMLTDLLDSLEAAEMEAPVLENGWSVKDILAHVMSWEQNLIKWVGQLLAGRDPERPFSGDDWIDRVNEQVYNAHRRAPLDEVEGAFYRSHEEVMEMVEELAPEVLLAPERFKWLQGAPLWRMVAANTNWHYREHRGLIADSLRSG